jgi:hypothetical protein
MDNHASKPKAKRQAFKFKKPSRKAPPPPAHFFQDLPLELSWNILALLSDMVEIYPLALFNLSLVCKATAAIVRSDPRCWERALSKYLTTDAEAARELRRFNRFPWRPNPTPTARQKLGLVIFRGCQICNTPRIRKVYYVRCFPAVPS